jgi:N-methylhydantoinase A
MERALRVISVERGYDPLDFAVVAFGGAGGLHVAELAERLGSRLAIVPPDPGLLSAYGMLASPVTREASRTIFARSDGARVEDLVDGTLAELEDGARRGLADEGAHSVEGTADEMTVERWIDARYVGQSYELAVPAAQWVARFHEAHRERYGYARPEEPVEAVTVRAVASVPAPRFETPELEPAVGEPPSTSAGVILGGRTLEARRVRRRDLQAGHDLPGPLIVQEYSATTWVPPEHRLRVDAAGCLHLAPASS